MIHPSMVHYDENQIRFSGADLETDAAAFYNYSGGSAPTAISPANHHSLAILRTHNESRALQAGNHAHALGFPQQVVRNAFILCVQDFVEHLAGYSYPFLWIARAEDTQNSQR